MNRSREVRLHALVAHLSAAAVRRAGGERGGGRRDHKASHSLHLPRPYPLRQQEIALGRRGSIELQSI